MTVDPVTFEIVKNSFLAAADEMGVVLRRSSFSSNIKERKDFSCALFDSYGRLVAEAEHIPVHLGAIPYSVKAIIESFQNDVADGDSFILNDPFHGGTHLPDITIVQPIFQHGDLEAFAANRAHHADVGGSTPGSMSPLSTNISQEGVLIPPTKLREKGKLNQSFLDSFLSRVRTPKERLGDLRAQEAANMVALRRLGDLRARVGIRLVRECMQRSLEYSERLMRGEIKKLPRSTVLEEDFLDDDGLGSYDIPIRLELAIRSDGAVFDFTGSSRQVKGALNAVYSITTSAVYYTIRCVTDPSIPANEGCFRPVTVIAPSGTIVNANPPAAVAGGNVETSQRIVDVCLKAFSHLIPERVCAACQGTMNNLTIGGTDPRTGRYFTYYETVAGGFGARKGKDGIDGVHSHMTNTMNTPVEALERQYPFRVRKYSLRSGSGGRGRFRGGHGIVREIQVFADGSTATLFGDRQKHLPWGLDGGSPGLPGEYWLARRKGLKMSRLASKAITKLGIGDSITVQTPGGGGYGGSRKRLPTVDS